MCEQEHDKIDDLESRLKASHQAICVASDRIYTLEKALRLLYEETADYIRINNLGDVHHNVSMQKARDALNLDH